MEGWSLAGIGDDVRAWARRRGCEVAFGPPDALRAVWAEIERRLARGEIDRRVRSMMSSGGLGDPELTARGRLIVVAVPRPAHRVTFHLSEGPAQVVIAPTYRGHRFLPWMVHEELATGPLPPGARLVFLDAPLKNLGARLGLVTYGRNNVTYHPNLGSYHQLIGFATDADLGDTTDQTPEMSLACEGCAACAEACPTSAIAEDRFLLRVDRCLALYGELEQDWPTWIPASAHNCLLGCLVCQEACPQNRGRLKYVDLGPAFTEEETAAILASGGESGQGAPRVTLRGARRKALRVKLAALDLKRFEAVLARNLRACLVARRGERSG